METSEYIDKHLSHNLSETKKKDFENKLISEPGFAKEVKENILIMNAFDEIKASELMEKMKSIESQVNLQEPEQSKYHPMLKWAAALGFSLVRHIPLKIYL